MQQIENGEKYKKKSPKNKFWNFSIWNKLNQTMVHLIGGLANPDIEAQRLLDMAQSWVDRDRLPTRQRSA